MSNYRIHLVISRIKDMLEYLKSLIICLCFGFQGCLIIVLDLFMHVNSGRGT